MRDSSLDTGSGNDRVDLNASTRAGAFDPAWGMEGSSLDTGSGNDRLRISANARGNTTDTIAAYGAVDSQLDTGSGNDRVDIRAAAFNRRGYAEAIGLDSSSLDTGSGNDRVRISARANGQYTNAWAMRDSSLNAEAGDNNIVIDGNALQSRILTGDGLDTIRISGLKTDQLLIDSGANDDVLKVDGGTRISYVSGEGSDLLQLSRNYFASLLQANNNEQANNEDAPLKAEAPTKKEVEQDFTESVLFEAPSSGLNLRDALKFEDFTTGIGGDSINVDDILRSYGVGLRRESIFADGFLSFQQNGNDSVLVFDADGADQQTKSDKALVVFTGIQASAFSKDNLDSVLINQDDFLLSQEAQTAATPEAEIETPIETPVFQPALDSQPTMDTNVDPVTGVGADQTLANGTIQPMPLPDSPAPSDATTMEMVTTQPLTSTALDLATAGLVAPVTIAPLPELEAGPAVSSTAVEAPAESFSPVAASPSISGPDAGPALSTTAAPAEVV